MPPALAAPRPGSPSDAAARCARCNKLNVSPLRTARDGFHKMFSALRRAPNAATIILSASEHARNPICEIVSPSEHVGDAAGMNVLPSERVRNGARMNFSPSMHALDAGCFTVTAFYTAPSPRRRSLLRLGPDFDDVTFLLALPSLPFDARLCDLRIAA